MLDNKTKKKIDNCRDILVGKIPDPKAQVGQITIALMYKFMDDMDKEAVEIGGKPTFFVDEYEQYSWTKLMSPKLGGKEKVNLYAEAITKMPQNPHIPQLFRDIFKGADLPYRAPETIRMFLKEINEFTYDYSERLGDAYEYLLSIMSSQGDAGMFRTPRNIIDFIVKVVDPKKDESVLDPACGTAGFLIAGYKHILKNNKDKLTPSEKEKLMNNFGGYDISPDMVKMAEVNMYLHKFPNPKIYEYDTLSSQKKWDETFDVIMANPPFMTPKGGIIPHNRFTIKSKRAEALFVDYIKEHLNIDGRAGVIVPEGIIFKNENAIKTLRKNLIEENYLYAVVSLPAGVFQPYAGVKTSILLMDKKLAKKTDKILFVKVENDGFDLGATRKPIDKNDLPQALEIINAWKVGKKIDSKIAVYVKKARIFENSDYDLSCKRYKETIDYSNVKWPMIELGEICEIVRDKPNAFEGNKKYYPTGSIDNNSKNNGFKLVTFDKKPSRANILPKKEDVGFAVMKGTKKIVYVNDDYIGSIFSTGFTFLRCSKKLISQFLYYLVKDEHFQNVKDEKAVDGIMGGIRKSDILKIRIPIPPLEIQQQIVAELDGYQNIISGARQVVENWKPTIDFVPNWGKVKMGDKKYIQIVDGDRGTNYPKKAEFTPEGFCLFLNTSNVRKGEFDFSKCDFVTQEKDNALRKGKLIREDVVLTTRGTIGNTAHYSNSIAFENIRINSGMVILRSNLDKISPSFLLQFMNSLEFAAQVANFISGSAQPQLPIRVLNEIEIPLPPLKIQKQIVEKIEAERALVESARKLIELYEQKIKDRIAKIWGK